MMRRDQKVRTQRHGLPRHHKQVRIVGQNDQGHGCEKHVIVKAEQSRSSASPDRKYPAAKVEIPVPAKPSNNRKNPDSASSRMWNGRSGSPSGRTITSGAWPVARKIPARNATPRHTRAPIGKSTRATYRMLWGRNQPSSPKIIQIATSIRMNRRPLAARLAVSSEII